MKKLPPYDEIPLLPNLIAETVCSTPYTGREVSNLSWEFIKRIEQARQNMTLEQIKEFAELCDQWCRAAYEKRAKWFVDCVRSTSNMGRDQLYVWITHWMASYLNDPQDFREKCASISPLTEIAE